MLAWNRTEIFTEIRSASFGHLWASCLMARLHGACLSYACMQMGEWGISCHLLWVYMVFSERTLMGLDCKRYVRDITCAWSTRSFLMDPHGVVNTVERGWTVDYIAIPLSMVPCVKRCKIFHKSGAILQKIARPGWRDRRPVHGTFYVTLSNSVRSSFAGIVTCWQGVFWKVPGKINWLKVSRRNCPIQCWIISARDLLARTGRLSTTRSGQSQWRCMVRSRLGKFGMQIPMLLIMIELLRHVVTHPFHPCDVVPMCCIFMTRSAFCEHGGPQSNIGNHDDVINNCSNVTKDFASLDYWQRSRNPGPPGVFHTCGNPLVHWLHVLWGQSGADMMCLYQPSVAEWAELCWTSC